MSFFSNLKNFFDFGREAPYRSQLPVQEDPGTHFGSTGDTALATAACHTLISAIDDALPVRTEKVYEEEVFDPEVAGFPSDWAKGSLLEQIREVMADGEAYTLADLSWITGAIESSCSARVRDLRKPKYGGHTVDREYVGGGLYTYRLTVLNVHTGLPRGPSNGR